MKLKKKHELAYIYTQFRIASLGVELCLVVHKHTPHKVIRKYAARIESPPQRTKVGEARVQCLHGAQFMLMWA